MHVGKTNKDKYLPVSDRNRATPASRAVILTARIARRKDLRLLYIFGPLPNFGSGSVCPLMGSKGRRIARERGADVLRARVALHGFLATCRNFKLTTTDFFASCSAVPIKRTARSAHLGAAGPGVPSEPLLLAGVGGPPAKLEEASRQQQSQRRRRRRYPYSPKTR